MTRQFYSTNTSTRSSTNPTKGYHSCFDSYNVQILGDYQNSLTVMGIDKCTKSSRCLILCSH